MRVDFIDPHRAEHGVEPNCKALPIAPSTYRRCKALERQPEKRSERGRRCIPTLPDGAAHKPLALVRRQFTVARPKPLWVADITHVPTGSGLVYVALAVDVYSRYIPACGLPEQTGRDGWRVLKPMQTD